MKRFVCILAAFAAMEFCDCNAENQPNKSALDAKDANWKLVWSDEFDYEGLPNPDKWGYEEGFVRNKELQYYTKERLENTEVKDGKLTITARKEKFKDANYTSASVISKGKGEWQYGRIEIFAKLPGGKGIWPAFWMLPASSKYGWPNGGEIDIMELVGFDEKRVHATVHTGYTMKSTKGGATSSTLLETPQNDFHLYVLEWYPDHLDFYVDGKQLQSYKKQGETIEKWPFDNKFYLLMNIAYGGAWGASHGTDDNILPQQTVVDYVRVYEKVKP